MFPAFDTFESIEFNIMQIVISFHFTILIIIYTCVQTLELLLLLTSSILVYQLRMQNKSIFTLNYYICSRMQYSGVHFVQNNVLVTMDLVVLSVNIN